MTSWILKSYIAGKLVFNNETLAIGDLLNRAATSNQGYADHYDVSLAVELNDCEACSVSADDSRLMQVLSNLMSNAIKYSPTGGCVRITAQCIEKIKCVFLLLIRVKASRTEFRDRIFTHFSQADSSDTREKGGTGLGLAISKEIIERQGGAIGFTSTPGRGTTFYFELDIIK